MLSDDADPDDVLEFAETIMRTPQKQAVATLQELHDDVADAHTRACIAILIACCQRQASVDAIARMLRDAHL